MFSRPLLKLFLFLLLSCLLLICDSVFSLAIENCIGQINIKNQVSKLGLSVHSILDLDIPLMVNLFLYLQNVVSSLHPYYGNISY
jgi:hypothetical protein